MGAVASAIVAALTALLPLIGSATGPAINQVIAFLIQAIPLVESEIASVAPSIENLITALHSNTAITTEQLQQLSVAEDAYDAAFEKAATAAGFPTPPDSN